MKRILYGFLALTCLVLAATPQLLRAQNHQWLTGGGSSFATPPGYSALEQVRETTIDSNGNIYVLAEIMASGSITFDTLTLPIHTGIVSRYRAKVALLSYNCSGRIRWGKIIEGNNDMRFAGLVYSNGHVYISGGGLNAGADIRYFGSDSTMTGSYHSSWLIKYDTLGAMQWMRSQNANTVPSYGPAGNWYNKLLMQDTLIHCIKSVFGSGAQLSPTVISQRGIYDYTYTPRGDLLSVVRLPLTDSMLVLNITVPSSLHSPTNMLLIALTNVETNQSSGVAIFDANRNLLRFDTLSTTGTAFAGNNVSSFRSGNAIYTFCNYYGTNCTYRGQTFNYQFTPLDGRFGFVMKTDLNNNLIWKRLLSSAAPGAGLQTWSASLDGEKMAFTGYARSVVIVNDTLLIPGTSSKIPIVIMDSSGNVQKMDYWNNNNPAAGLEGGMTVSLYNGSAYIGGVVSDSIWAGSYGYKNHGGPTDILLAKYGYTCNCTQPLASFTQAAGSNGQISFTFTGTTAGIDSIRWQFGDGSTSTAVSPSHTYAAGSYNACVTVYNSCGNSHSCQPVTIQTGTGIHHLAFSGVKVYPNPAAQVLMIENATPGTQLVIYNVTGQIVRQLIAENGSGQINISSLAPGAYMLRAVSGSQHVVWRFAKE